MVFPFISAYSLAIRSGTRYVTATGNMRGSGLANLALIAAVSRTISAGISRTLARKAERRAVAGVESGEVILDPSTLAFLNRLSSLMYALARLTNHKSGIKEEPPSYK